MFNIFKKDPAKRLQKQYDKLMEENYHLSKTNRKLADQKYAEAEAVMQKIVALKQQDK
ncbi:Lacal_2735 family protein [Draconibacterium sediminis]|uniref:Lacal_2735 family protein n=1 Tax=Draconibacterium sediminis TaxID=1544798 RepID=UPI0026EA049C|nr:Lacal_2735 family protein [Draconibacterium sediminis]